jgi:hypothetical protein
MSRTDEWLILSCCEFFFSDLLCVAAFLFVSCFEICSRFSFCLASEGLGSDACVVVLFFILFFLNLIFRGFVREYSQSNSNSQHTGYHFFGSEKTQDPFELSAVKISLNFMVLCSGFFAGSSGASAVL